MTLSEPLEEASKVERDVREYFSSGGKEMNIFEYLKFCSEVVPGLAEMSHSETDTEKKKQLLLNAMMAYKFVYGALQAQRKLSAVCQKAVDLDAELEALPDGVRDDALETAAASFFDECGLSGSYAISQNELIRHEATADEIRLDSDALGILVGNLMLALQDLWDLEKEYALRKAVVLRKYRRKK